jgi:hypothetical protein
MIGRTMAAISIEGARQQDWVAATSPRVDRVLVGKMSDERLSANLEAARQAAIRQYGSEAALRHALKEGVVVESYLKYKGERYVVHAAHNPLINKPAMMVMYLDEAHARALPIPTGTASTTNSTGPRGHPQPRISIHRGSKMHNPGPAPGAFSGDPGALGPGLCTILHPYFA